MKTGVNNPCHCGSGKKYKKCHQSTETEKMLHPKELTNKIRQQFEMEICLHPQASKSNCGKIIKAHTIQRKGAISKIIDSTNHVYYFDVYEREPNQLLKLNKIGWKKASTFNGFCSPHDSTLFADLETQPFVGSEKQCFLIGYRAMCHELHQKLGASAGNPILKKQLVAGKSKADQKFIQETISYLDEGINAAKNDLNKIKTLYDDAFLKDDFSDINYVVISFNGDISVVSTGAVIPDFDVNGNYLQNIADLSKDIEGFMFGTVSTDTGGAFVFSWLSKFKLCNKFIDSLLAIPNDEIPSVLLEFMFGYVSNTYFSKDWWDSLDKSKQNKVRHLASDPIANGHFIKYSKDHYTDWKITNINKHIK